MRYLAQGCEDRRENKEAIEKYKSTGRPVQTDVVTGREFLNFQSSYIKDLGGEGNETSARPVPFP